jgi:secondary thiamine-phosphate synthase enzyme
MKTYRDKIQLETKGEFDIVDVTADVEKAIIASGIEDGYALIYSPHTTCGVMVNEKERGLLEDMKRTLRSLVPVHDDYLHDDFTVRTENMHPGETKNAHAHLRHMVGGKTSEYIPVGEGSLLLGVWQRVMVVEFDCSRNREIVIQICGE